MIITEELWQKLGYEKPEVRNGMLFRKNLNNFRLSFWQRHDTIIGSVAQKTDWPEDIVTLILALQTYAYMDGYEKGRISLKQQLKTLLN